MGEAIRTAGIPGTFRATFSQTPVETPTAVLYSDAGRTLIAVPSAPLLATANPNVWLVQYPASLPAARYYLVVSAVYSAGQPAALDQNDTLLLQAAEVGVADGLVELEQVKTYLGLQGEAQYDDELRLLIGAATPLIEELVGPVLPRTVTETVRGRVLRQSPVLSVLAVERGGLALTPTEYVLDAPAGLLNGTALVGSTITYVAGLETVPADVQRAALRWISWSWRRDHGGSETYQPGGDDATIPGPGVRGIEAELRHILSARLRGMRVA